MLCNKRGVFQYVLIGAGFDRNIQLAYWVLVTFCDREAPILTPSISGGLAAIFHAKANCSQVHSRSRCSRSTLLNSLSGTPQTIKQRGLERTPLCMGRKEFSSKIGRASC